MRTAAALWRRVLEHRDAVVASGIAVASAVRIGYVIYLGDDIGGPDGPTYHQAATDLVSSGLLSDDVRGLPYFPPGYPLLVALHYALAGPHPLAVKLTQVAAIAVMTWVSYRLAGWAAGPVVATIAGVGLSLSPAWLALAHPLMYEPIQATLLVSGLLLCARADESSGWWRSASAGGLLGLAAALQDKFLTLLPLLALWLYLGRDGTAGRLRRAAIFCAAAVVVIAPFVVRNRLAYGEGIVLATNHGINLLMGNGPDATGGYVDDDVVPDRCRSQLAAASDEQAKDRVLTRCGLTEMVRNPGRVASLVPARLIRLWGPFVGPRYEAVNWKHYVDPRWILPRAMRYSDWFETLDRRLSAAWAIGGLALAACGSWLLCRARGRSGVLLVLPVTWLVALHGLTFGDPRFRIPILPVVLILQVAALVALFRRRQPVPPLGDQ